MATPRYSMFTIRYWLFTHFQWKCKSKFNFFSSNSLLLILFWESLKHNRWMINDNWLRPTSSKESQTGPLGQRAHKKSWICLKSSPVFKYHRLGRIRPIKFHYDLHFLDLCLLFFLTNDYSFSIKRVVSFWANGQHKICVKQAVKFENGKKPFEGLWMS